MGEMGRIRIHPRSRLNGWDAQTWIAYMGDDPTPLRVYEINGDEVSRGDFMETCKSIGSPGVWWREMRGEKDYPLRPREPSVVEMMGPTDDA